MDFQIILKLMAQLKNKLVNQEMEVISSINFKQIKKFKLIKLFNLFY